MCYNVSTIKKTKEVKKIMSKSKFIKTEDKIIAIDRITFLNRLSRTVFDVGVIGNADRPLRVTFRTVEQGEDFFKKVQEALGF